MEKNTSTNALEQIQKQSVDGSQIFGDGNVLEDMVSIDWVNNILSQNETDEKKIDLYIFDIVGIM